MDPATSLTVLDSLAHHAAQRADRLAFDAAGESSTYGELADRVRRMAAGLDTRGLGPGERSAVLLPTSLEAVVAVLASQWVGAAPVIIDDKLPADMILRRLDMVRPRVVIASPEVAERCRASMNGSPGPWVTPEQVTPEPGPDLGTFDHRARPEDPGYLQLTSGTLGEPKAAVITHRALVTFLDVLGRHIEATPEDKFITWVPLYHDYGLIHFLFLPLYVGCEGHLVPPSVTNFGRWLREIDRLRATVTGGPDFGYRVAARMVKPEEVDLSCLRIVGCGGEPVKPDTIRHFQARFDLPHPIMPGYGQAETTLAISAPRIGDPLRIDAAGTVANGRPLPGFEVRIADAEGNTLPPGEVGEIHVQGPCLFEGYFEDPEATAAAFKEDWLDTGDTGYLDEEGYLFILGRRRAMIKRAGALISPREIEEASQRVEGIRKTAAIGAPEAGGGHTEKLVLLAEIAPGRYPRESDRAALAERVSAIVATSTGHELGDVILLKPGSIELTQNGKIRYPAIRRHYLENNYADSGALLFPAPEKLGAPPVPTPAENPAR